MSEKITPSEPAVLLGTAEGSFTEAPELAALGLPSVYAMLTIEGMHTEDVQGPRAHLRLMVALPDLALMHQQIGTMLLQARTAGVL